MTRPKKNNTSGGVITFHMPFPVSLLKSEELMTDVKDVTDRRVSPSQPSVRMRSNSKCASLAKKDEASHSGPGAKQDRLSHASLRRLQAKMEAESQQVKEILQPLLDTENGFMKEVERFLSQQDATELRRRELLHKRWTERVRFPLQRRVEEHVSSCSQEAAEKRQSLYSDYLHHCNTKGFVFLETYDLREYNPFLLHIKKPHYFKPSAADLKDPFYLQLHERLTKKRRACSCEAECKYPRGPIEELPQKESVTSQTNRLLQASSNHPVTAARKIQAQDETEGRKSSRLDGMPYSITATASPDGRCHQTGCWLSRRGGRRQPAGLQRLRSSPSSK